MCIVFSDERVENVLLLRDTQRVLRAVRGDANQWNEGNSPMMGCW